MLLRALAAAGLFVCSACVGEIGNEGAAGGGGAAKQSEGICTTSAPGESPLRPLTRHEYDNTVRDLLGDEGRESEAFPPESGAVMFDNDVTASSISPAGVEKMLVASERIATRAIEKLAALAPCGNDDACARTFITDFGARALRRPLESAEIESYFALYKTSDTFPNGVRLVLERMLQSPYFLYRVEVANLPSAADGSAPLDDYEVASRLSYFLWETMPDSALFESARLRRLSTAEGIAAETTRMLADPRAKRTIARFHAQWLGLGAIDGLDRDPKLFPEFSPELRRDMRASVERLIDHVMTVEGGSVEALFTANYAFVNAPLGKLMGLPVESARELVRVPVDPAQRLGLLTSPGLLAALSKYDQTSPIRRGVFVQTRLLCTELAAPPPGADLALPPVSETATTRERFAKHTANPECAGCHRLIDPVGFGFENYNAVGAYVAEENGKPVDASGELPNGDTAGTFNGAVELSRRLGKSRDVQGCVVRQWFRFAHGRRETAADLCTLNELQAKFASGGGTVPALVRAIAESKAFRTRALEEKP